MYIFAYVHLYVTLGLEESGFAFVERCLVKVNTIILTSRLMSLRAGCLISVIGFALLSFYYLKKEKETRKQKQETPPNNRKYSSNAMLCVSISKLQLPTVHYSLF